MKLEWRKLENLSYHAKCGLFDAYIHHYADSRIEDCPAVAWTLYLSGNKRFRNGFCHSVRDCKRAVEETIKAEIIKLINESDMKAILEGG